MSSDAMSFSDTVIAKSDQLNADDLIGGPITVTITGVKRGDSEQPVVLAISGQRPYKPCKSMRRVLITAWGDDGRAWVGRSMTLYCDPDVKFGGVKVGGIRISHMSHIESDLVVGMNVAKGKKGAHPVKRLKSTVVYYPADKFAANFPKWRPLIAGGTHTAEQVIAKAEEGGSALTEEQKAQIRAVPVTTGSGDEPAAAEA